METAALASLVVGADFWHTRAHPEAGIRSIEFADGPHGLRKQLDGDDHLGIVPGAPATCFPPAVALASTWDPELAREVGAALGAEARAAGVDVLLGPGMNIARSVRGGRNFEYFSEDPHLTARFGAAMVEGVQSTGVGASPKHFAANNQETERLRISSEVEERTLREIYLRAFRTVVTEAHPATVMCSYNAVNGVFAAENRWLLTDVLREEWGFEGVVVSDWGAVHDTAQALAAGLDLRMPGGAAAAGEVDALVAAVAEGRLEPEALRRAADRVAQLARRTAPAAAEAAAAAALDLDAHHDLARRVATRSIVLLRNEGELLPLDPRHGSVAVIGELARTPRHQGAGSSQVVPTRLENALDELRRRAAGAVIDFAPGYRLDGSPDPGLREEAVALAAGHDVVVLFAGLPDGVESEGFDRPDIELPAEQTALLAALLAANLALVVVLANGGVIRSADWSRTVPALLEGWLLGQAGGSALASVLLGEAEPCGRLPCTVPLRLADTPDYLDFPGHEGRVGYSEGIFVGYRWYDRRQLAVDFPFGHGLGYTRFRFRDLQARLDGDVVRVSVAVRNTGRRTGRETVQIYAGLPSSRLVRAERELRGFAGVDLDPGEETRVTVEFARSELAYYSVAAGRWVVEGGDYTVWAGSSSRDLPLEVSLPVTGDRRAIPLTGASPVTDWLTDTAAAPLIRSELDRLGLGLGESSERARMIGRTALQNLALLPGSRLTAEVIAGLTVEAAAADADDSLS